jgi:hypothetical protein
MIIQRTYALIYEQDGQRIRERIHAWLLFGLIPLYQIRREEWRRAALVGDELRRAVLVRDQWQCAYCGCRRRNQLAIDHLIPQVQGGRSVLANLRTACRACNSAKQGKTPEEAGMVLAYGRYRERNLPPRCSCCSVEPWLLSPVELATPATPGEGVAEDTSMGAIVSPDADSDDARAAPRPPIQNPVAHMAVPNPPAQISSAPVTPASPVAALVEPSARDARGPANSATSKRPDAEIAANLVDTDVRGTVRLMLRAEWPIPRIVAAIQRDDAAPQVTLALLAEGWSRNRIVRGFEERRGTGLQRIRQVLGEEGEEGEEIVGQDEPMAGT